MTPKSVRIIGKTYAIKFVDEVDDDDSLGEHRISTQTILVKTAQHEESKRETILHEVTHAIEEQMGLGMKEKQVHGLSVGLFQVIRENPDLVRYLLEKPKRRGK